jgi:hypothetical protein
MKELIDKNLSDYERIKVEEFKGVINTIFNFKKA